MVLINNRKRYLGVKKDPTKYWYVEKYVYGKLKETIEIPLKTSTKFTALNSGYDDDTFYGWSISPTSTSRSFTATTSYSNTSTIVKNNLDNKNTLRLYAIFSYRITNIVPVRKSVSVDLSATESKTLTVTDAKVGGSYTVSTSIYVPYQITSPVYDSNGKQIGVNYSIGSKPSGGSSDDYTADSSTISYTFNSYGSTSSSTMYSGTASATSQPSATKVQSPSGGTGTITYDTNATTTSTGSLLYRVVSHDDPSIINIYRYGVLYNTLSVQEGCSITIDEVDSEYSDDTFYGYSVSPTSTERIYNSGIKVTPHGVLNLYAVYSYSAIVEGSKTVSDKTEMGNSAQTKTLSATAEIDGTATFSSKAHLNTPGGEETIGNTFKVNNTSYNGSYSMSVSAGETVTMEINIGTPQYGSYVASSILYPAMIEKTLYRVESHS